MDIFNDELNKLKQKKNDAIFEKTSQSQDKYALPEVSLMSNEHVNKSSQKASVYTSAYRQILEHDFTSKAWIGRTADKRKHRKHINSNYKTITGKKWTGLSSEEKDLRKTEFEGRRNLSLKASEQVADFLIDLNKSEAFGHDEDLAFLDKITGVDCSTFDYPGDTSDTSSTKADEAFLDKFKENMPLLHRAYVLYEGLLEEGSFPELEGEKRMNVMAKLAYLKEVRTAYEDRIRIISSPYYVSLREKDFVGDAPEHLEELQKNKKEPAPLRSYAASVLRWRNKGHSLLQRGVLTDMEMGQAFLEDDIKSRKQTDTYASDKTVDGIIGKLRVNNVNSILNDKRDMVSVGMSLMTAKDWVYSDLNKKVSKKDITARLNEMQSITTAAIQRITSDPEKYRKEKEESLNKDYEKIKQDHPDYKPRVVTKEDVELDLKRRKGVLTHLKNVSKQFTAGEISVEVMKLWLDRGLQYDIRMGRELYDGIVLQKYNMNREEDDHYMNTIDNLIKKYHKTLQGGIVTVQGSHKAYVRAEDEGKVSDKKAMYKKIDKYPEDNGILPGKSDFVHIIGGKASSTDIATRAYISAKHQYKSMAVDIFMKTITELKVKDKVYFKIISKANNGFYGMDDLTVFFTVDLSVAERKKILDTFYENCNINGENILNGKDMCVTCTKYKEGIALAPEPSFIDTLNTLFLDDSMFNDNKRLNSAMANDVKVRQNFSYNTFITSMFCQSAITANYMMGKGASKDINVADKKTLSLIKKIFRQLCFLNGVNPEIMAKISDKTILG